MEVIDTLRGLYFTTLLLVLGGLLAVAVIELFRADNCLTYAWRLYRYGRHGDHLVFRRSHWGWFPHFSVLFELENGDLVRKEYVPLAPRPRWLPPLTFPGKEVTTYYRKETAT